MSTTANPTSNASGAALTGDTTLDGLMQGSLWVDPVNPPYAPINFTYAFYSTSATNAVWDSAQQADVAQAFQAWSNVTNITFTLVGSNLTPGDFFQQAGDVPGSPTFADIAVSLNGPPDAPGVLAFSTFPDPAMADADLTNNGLTRTDYPQPEGDIFVFNTNAEFQDANMNPGGYGFLAILHELGHSLGLKHPFDDGGAGRPLLDPSLDDQYHTIMSYLTPQDQDFGSVQDNSKGFSSTPMPLDIYTIQYLYGANLTFHTGNDVYTLTRDGQVQTIWDAGGTDTLDGHLLPAGINMSLEDGSFTHLGDGYSTVAIAYAGQGGDAQAALIENAIGTAFNDTITGNLLDNTLTGGAGNDSLEGHLGNDTLIGGAGNDTYVVHGGIDTGTEVLVEGVGGGTDTVQSDITYDMGPTGNNLVNVENLTLTGSGAIDGTGTDFDNVITGNGAVNVLTGNGGNDTLDGGGAADSMLGGLGNDTYVIDNASDVVQENALEGTDLVKSFTASYTLTSDVENLTLAGTTALIGIGNTSDNIITGNALGNTIDGGAGNDTMIGGAGDDTYFIDVTTDVITDSSGNDTVIDGTVNYTLGPSVENLTLTGVMDLAGVGNGFHNVLIGNDGNNTFTSNGGHDVMSGGQGNDTYFVTAGDVIIENAGEGTADAISTTQNWTLGDNIEDLIMAGSVYKGVGNSGDNVITGNAIGNYIDGGAGADTMIGGAGSDSYIVDNIGDIVTENPGGGTDIIYSSVSYTIAANVETLVLTVPGTATGDGANNTLIGSSGIDTLDGGAGNDVMTGNAGNDVYFVDSAGDKVNDTGGIDTVNASIDYTLGLNVENLTLIGGAISGTGNGANNIITGNASDNILNGGVAADTLIGGLGNDTYIVDNAGDIIVENTGEGTDLAFASASYTLADLSEVENLTLTGTAVSGTGNSFDNTITGNAGTNTLDGGSAGNDLLIGLAGNDTYIIDRAGVLVQEGVNGGTDTIKSSLATYDLSVLDTNVENLVLTAPGSTGIGNALNNRITGSFGNESLDGGVGADTMAGGLGNDTYFVDNAHDGVVEAASAGNDIVFSSVNYTMPLNVEQLTLTGTALVGTGSSGANVITGDGMNNTLLGMGGNDTLEGGLGADTLTGGLNADTFLFKPADLDGNLDSITDFSKATGGDVIDISAVLTGYTLGDVITNFVQITTVGTHSVLAVDPLGGSSFTSIANINGTNLTDVIALVNSGHLIL